MPRGGARPGSGRKKGSRPLVTQMRQTQIAKAAFSGVSPLDYMLEVLRDETKPWQDRFEAAKAAAPYVHPRLAAIEHSGNQDKPLAYEVVSSVPRPPMIEHVDSDDRTADHLTH